MENIVDKYGLSKSLGVTPIVEPTIGWGEGLFKGIGAGAVAAVDETVSTAVEVGEWIGHVTNTLDESEDWSWKEMRGEQWFDADFGTTGNVAKAITKFGIGMVGVGKLKAIQSLGRVGGAMAAGAIADFTLSTKDEGLISDFLADMNRNEYGEVSNSILKFMATDESDSDLEFKLKATLEGGFLGVALDTAVGAFKGIAKLGRAHVNTKAKGDPNAKRSILEAMGGNGNDVRKSFEESVLTDANYAQNVIHAKYDAPQDVVNKKVDDIFGADDYILKTIKVHPEEAAEAILTRSNGNVNDIYEMLEAKGLWDDGVQEIGAMIDAFAKKVADRSVLKQGHQTLDRKAQRMFDDLGLKDIKDHSMFAKTATIRQRMYAQIEDRMTSRIEGLMYGKRTAAQATELQARLLSYMNLAPDFADIRAEAGRGLKARDLNTAKHYDYNTGKASSHMSAVEVDKQTSEAALKLLNTKEGKKLLGDIEQAGGVKEYFEVARGKHIKGEESSAMKWARAYESFRHQNMLSGFATGIMNVSSTGMKVFTDQTMAPVLAGLREGDAQQIKQGLTAFTSFWGNVHSTGQGLIGAIGDLEGDDVTKKVMTLIDANKRKRVIEKQKTVSHLHREGAAEGNLVTNTAEALNLKEGSWYAKAMDFATGINSIPSIGTIDLPDLFQGNAGFAGAFDGLIARDLYKAGMTAEAKLNLRKNLYSFAEYGAKNNGRMPKGVPEEYGRWVTTSIDEAKQMAREGLFQQHTGAMQKIIKGIKEVNNPAGKVLATTIAPFMSTPANIINTIGEMTPAFNLLYKTSRDELRGVHGVARKAQREAKTLIGASLYASGAGLYMSGNLTGSHPKQDRVALVAAGVPEHSVKIGQTWYSYTRLDPFGSFLGLMADTVQAVEVAGVEDGEAAVQALVHGIGQLTANKTYLRGVGDIMKAVLNPEADKGAFVKNWATTLVPMSSGQRWLNKQIDPQMKDNHEFIAKMRAVMVSRNDKREAKLDAFGYEIGDESLISRVFGIRTMSASDNADPYVLTELAATRAWPADRDGSYKGVKLTREEARSAKNNMRSRNAYGQLTRVVYSFAYQRANVGDRQKLLRSKITDIRTKGREDLLRTDAGAIARHRTARREITQTASRMSSITPSSNLRDILEQRLTMKAQ